MGEFRFADNRVFYRINITPPGSSNCTSYASCKKRTGKNGFSSALAILPKTSADMDPFHSRCGYVTCKSEGCPDGMSYPGEKGKTYNCPDLTLFRITFCA